MSLCANVSGQETIIWPDSSEGDYIYRPMTYILENMCSYKMVMKFKKVYKKFKEKKKMALPVNQGTRQHKFTFKDSHPRKEFCHLVALTLLVIPKSHLPKGNLCSVERLDVNNDFVTNEVVLEDREDFIMMALLMFYPFRCINDLKLNNSHWKK